MKLYDLIKDDEYITHNADPDTDIDSLATSIENIKDNCLYIAESESAISGLNALKIKPKVIVLKHGLNIKIDIPAISVKNPKQISSLIHARFYKIDFNKLKFIGITGTNGKTTTATMIYSVLMHNGITAGFIGTAKIESNGKRLNDTNYSMTTPPPGILYKSIRQMQDAGCSYIVMEVSSHALAQDRVYPIPFEYAVFTNLSNEHMDYHQTLEEYYNTKKKLFRMTKKSVLNIDDPYARRLCKEIEGEYITTGVLFAGDVYVRNIEDHGFDGLSYYYFTEKYNFSVKLNIAGIYNIYNSLLASAVCIDLGIPPCKVKEALSQIYAISGRFEIIKDEITVIIDYAHTSEAFASVMKSISDSKGASPLTVIFGCGGQRDVTKRPIMAAYAEKYADHIIVTSDNPRNEDPGKIITDIVKGFRKSSYATCVDRREAIINTILNASRGDIVAIIGKGAEEYNIDKDGYHPFSEKDIVSDALRLRHENNA